MTKHAIVWGWLVMVAAGASATEPRPAEPLPAELPAESKADRSGEQRLLDILLDRGIITEQEHADLSEVALESDAPNPRRTDLESRVEEVISRGFRDEEDAQAGYRKGFYIESGDGLFSLRMKGFVQARYTYRDFDGQGTRSDDSSFSTPRVRLDFRGHAYDPNVRYRIQADFDDSSDDGSTVLKDAWIEYNNPDHHYAFRAGQFKVPFGRQQLASAAQLQFVDKVGSSGFFGFGRDVGVMFSMTDPSGKVGVSAGIFNGEGEDMANNDNDHLYAIRAELNPAGEFKKYEGDVKGSDDLAFSIGANIAYAALGRDDTMAIFGAEDDADQQRYGLDAALRFMGLSLTGEIFTMKTDDDGGGPADFRTIDDRGFYVQSGYFVVPGSVEVAGRYSAQNRDDDNTGADDDTTEIGLALNYYFKQHNHKVQLDCTRRNFDPDTGAELTDYIFRLQWQLAW